LRSGATHPTIRGAARKRGQGSENGGGFSVGWQSAVLHPENDHARGMNLTRSGKGIARELLEDALFV
jgi:hypothetical protein